MTVLVVSYWISTSNHNSSLNYLLLCIVVSYWISTSNHNLLAPYEMDLKLYLIEFLHQTTTYAITAIKRIALYLIEFLHQTTTVKSCSCTKSRCILLNFYIKPQLKPSKDFDQAGCILLNFYIKPQQCILAAFDRMVVSYWISTSNHNIEQSEYNGIALYLIEFLHQTTTGPYLFAADRRCILLNFYIKPQHVQTVDVERCGCILLNFYIKPQLKPSKDFDQAVVSYWISTSNHNLSRRSLPPSPVVSYWISTSNHNFIPIVSYSQGLYLIEFLHQTTTTSDLVLILGMLYLIEFLHQTTTQGYHDLSHKLLYLIEFLHQTTTW